ncbi:aromatase/cyclase (plasmid) [Streptomyces sp. NBC_00868]|uniref:aromatase/cyclase n=1 Tax=unclassified Streptomyces TaxID=2593676 RepID=UPI002F909AD5|nr:aromatase/cyclase [Streptomyces sp. NBC_00868]
MSGERVHHKTYTVDVTAPAGVVYGLIADTTQWPLIVPPSVHVERLDFDGTEDRFQMWVTANGQVKSWFSRRAMDPVARRVDFRQETPAAPALAMGGRWSVDELGATRSRLTLDHDFTVAEDRPDDAAWLARATDTNSRAELDRIKETAENWASLDDLLLTFEDRVTVKAPPELVYSFLYGVDDWPAHLPHVSRVNLTEDVPGIQLLSMDTLTGDGSRHTTESVRICFPHAYRIVYKQTATPRLLAAHTGEWSLFPDETGVTAVSRHSVLLREEAIAEVLGPDADIAQARAYVREALGRNSVATLGRAAQHAESAVRTL